MIKTPTVKASWARIEGWLESNAPSYAKALGKPATPEEIAKLSDKMGITLPKPFIDSCMIHAGQKSATDFIPDGFGTFYLMQLKEIPREWKMLNDLKAAGDFDDSKAEPDEGVLHQWWSDTWIPFAANGGGDLFCLDCTPPKGGKKWQVVKFVHDRPTRTLVAPSFAAWLAGVADAIERGELEGLIDG